MSFTCCQGVCASAGEQTGPQNTPPAIDCADDRDCRPLSGITIELEASALAWKTALSASPGTLPANALVIATADDTRASALVQDDGSFSPTLKKPR